jgi:hypothetical protein
MQLPFKRKRQHSLATMFSLKEAKPAGVLRKPVVFAIEDQWTGTKNGTAHDGLLPSANLSDPNDHIPRSFELTEENQAFR